MSITSQHITGFAFGLGVAAVGLYMYKKNELQVDDFLRSQGVPVPVCGSRDAASLTLEELVAEKERLEDLIAERQHAAAEPQVEAGSA
jgi:hypothetical protein